MAAMGGTDKLAGRLGGLVKSAGSVADRAVAGGLRSGWTGRFQHAGRRYAGALVPATPFHAVAGRAE